MSTTTTYFVPGRVNLIGEHIDYNGGLVMPIALNIGITARCSTRTDQTIVLSSATHSKVVQIDLANIPDTYTSDNDWCNYPIGVILALQKKGISLKGMDLHYESNLPEGSGLSSSAAIEVLTAYIILHQAGQLIDLPSIALLCQQVENNYIGVKCGIMDQYAVANGKQDHAMLLNCDTLACEQIPFDLDDYALVVINSKKPRTLIKSAYNERKAESEEALRLLVAAKKLKAGQHLVEAQMEDLIVLNDPIIRQRARHVVSENLRVRHAVAALRMGDLHTFGRLMNASHHSMKEDYEVTGIEMDTLAETAQNITGCLGARMTGGGFGGCAIALVRQSAIASFKEILSKRYQTVTGLQCEYYICGAEQGVRVINQ
jgi:galactokinase